MSRAGEVTAKLARVRGWLDGTDFDAALSEDTFIVGGSGVVVPITNTAGWPTVSGRPAILPV